MAQSPPQEMLDLVEDELLLLLKDSETLTAALQDLPGKTKEAQDAAESILSRLAKAHEGILDNLDSLEDYLPFERSATQARSSAHLAKTDLEAAKSTLDALFDKVQLEEEEISYDHKKVRRM